MTPNDIIARALRDSGVTGQGQSASAEDFADAFIKLNGMLALWQRKRWLVYHLVDVSKVSTGAQAYTVGAGGDFNILRPDRLEAAFFRQIVPSQPNLVDYPLQILEAREDYNLIALKTLGPFGGYIFYDAAFPLGSVYVWPVLAANTYELHLTLKADLGQFTSPGQTVNLPPEYLEALSWNLAARLRPAYQLAPDPSVTALASDALNAIRGANAQIPRARLPGDLTGSGRYNVYSDQGR